MQPAPLDTELRRRGQGVRERDVSCERDGRRVVLRRGEGVRFARLRVLAVEHDQLFVLALHIAEWRVSRSAPDRGRGGAAAALALAQRVRLLRPLQRVVFEWLDDGEHRHRAAQPGALLRRALLRRAERSARAGVLCSNAAVDAGDGRLDARRIVRRGLDLLARECEGRSSIQSEGEVPCASVRLQPARRLLHEPHHRGAPRCRLRLRDPRSGLVAPVQRFDRARGELADRPQHVDDGGGERRLLLTRALLNFCRAHSVLGSNDPCNPVLASQVLRVAT